MNQLLLVPGVLMVPIWVAFPWLAEPAMTGALGTQVGQYMTSRQPTLGTTRNWLVKGDFTPQGGLLTAAAATALVACVEFVVAPTGEVNPTSRTVAVTASTASIAASRLS
jgi:hypothetical protein